MLKKKITNKIYNKGLYLFQLILQSSFKFNRILYVSKSNSMHIFDSMITSNYIDFNFRILLEFKLL